VVASAVYGPVPSWRLGRSLGIDPLLPPKTCTFDCIYCQLGRTINKILRPESIETTVKVDKVLKDLETALRGIAPESIDYVTFSGTGEPTLNLELGEMIVQIRKLTGEIPIAVLTNASLVNRKDVRTNLTKADLIVAKLDAPNQKLFETINRPAEGLKLDTIIEGLKLLRREASCRLALQIMFLESDVGVRYNTESNCVEALIESVDAIKPDEVEVNTPTRPPSEPSVRAVPPEKIEEIADRFERMLSGVKVISRTRPTLPKQVRKKPEALGVEILDLITRRPCTLEDIMKATGAKEGEIDNCLRRLMELGSIGSIRFAGRTYYKVLEKTI